VKRLFPGFLPFLLLVGCEAGRDPIVAADGTTIAVPVDGAEAEDLQAWEFRDEQGRVTARGIYRGSPWEESPSSVPEDIPRKGREGKWTFYHPEGGVDVEGTFKEGREEGVFTWWYPDGKPRQRGSFRQGRRQGSWEAWHETGNLRWRGSFQDGREEGEAASFHPNGIQSSRGNYQAGKEEGEWVFSRPNGRERARGDYRDGLRSGRWIFRDAQGRPAEEGNYSSGERTGRWTFFRAGGEKLNGEYRAGRRQGYWTLWAGQSEISREMYLDDRPLSPEPSSLVERDDRECLLRERNGYYLWGSWVDNGTLYEWYPSGQPSRREHYRDGVLQGPLQLYYAGGALMLEGSYDEGKRDGSWRLLDVEGRLLDSVRYQNGNPVEGRELDLTKLAATGGPIP